MSVAPDGRLVTKGDANATNDSTTVDITAVHGMGRLLVRFVGLPLLWWQTGQWAWLLLFLASILIAARAVSLDGEDDDEPGTDPPDRDRGEGPPTPTARRRGRRASTARGQHAPLTSSRTARQTSGVRPPAAGAALARLCCSRRRGRRLRAPPPRTRRSSWQVPNWDYTTEVDQPGPLPRLEARRHRHGRHAAGQLRQRPHRAPTTPAATDRLHPERHGGAADRHPEQRCHAEERQPPASTRPRPRRITAPSTVTVIAWIKAAAGYERASSSASRSRGPVSPRRQRAPTTGSSTSTATARPGSRSTTTATTRSLAVVRGDGSWHMLVGTLGAAGMRLYVDGVQVASNANTGGEATTGWWRVGCGNLGRLGHLLGRRQRPGHRLGHGGEPPLHQRLRRRDQRLHQPADGRPDRLAYSTR